MSIVSSKLPLLDKGRELAEHVGLRPTRVTITKRTYVSKTGSGAYSDAITEIKPRPLVEQIGGTAGQADGRFRISRITPSFGSGGWTLDDLHPSQPVGTIVWYTLSGPFGRDRQCHAVEIDLNSAFGIVVTVEDRK